MLDFTAALHPRREFGGASAIPSPKFWTDRPALRSRPKRRIQGVVDYYSREASTRRSQAVYLIFLALFVSPPM